MAEGRLAPAALELQEHDVSAPNYGADFLYPDKPRLELVKDNALLDDVIEVVGHNSKLPSPVDNLTKMPLPIIPTDTLPRFKDSRAANWHHHYHPSADPALTSISGLAVRHLRLQLLPIKSRHQVYHDIFSGPEFLPETQEERFGHIILASAGYMPRFGIDVTAEDPTVPVAMPQKMHNRLQNSGEIAVRGNYNIANFIRKYLVVQDLSHVNESVVEEFLETTSIERKRYLGHWLLAIASEIATEPVKPAYHQALDDGLIKTKIKPESVVKLAITGQKTRNKTIDDLRRRLTKIRRDEEKEVAAI